MKNKVPISIIIPCYNDEKYIAQCLDSIVAQIDAKSLLEVIVVDDGSTDQSAAIVQQYCDKWDNIQLLSKRNGGQGAARNLGVAHANGCYIYFLDSDDYLTPDAMKSCYECALETGADIITFNTVPFEDNASEGCIMQTYQRSLVPDYSYSGMQIVSHMVANDEFYPPVWLYFYRTDFYKATMNGFIEGIVYEDTPFSFRMLNQANSVVYLNKTLHYRRIRSNSTMRQKLKAKHIYSNNLGIKDMLDYYRSLSDAQRTSEQLKFIRRITAGNVRTIMLADSSDSQKRQRVIEYLVIIKENPMLISIQMPWEWIKSWKTLVKYSLKKVFKRNSI